MMMMLVQTMMMLVHGADLDAGDLDPAVKILVVGEMFESPGLSLQVSIQGIQSSVRCGPVTRPDLGGGRAHQGHVALVLTHLRIFVSIMGGL